MGFAGDCPGLCMINLGIAKPLSHRHELALETYFLWIWQNCLEIFL